MKNNSTESSIDFEITINDDGNKLIDKSNDDKLHEKLKLIKKISLVYKGENLVPANMVVHDKKVYFSNLWKANLMNIVLTELTPEDYDFNEYSSGTYSVDVKSIVP